MRLSFGRLSTSHRGDHRVVGTHRDAQGAGLPDGKTRNQLRTHAHVCAEWFFAVTELVLVIDHGIQPAVDAPSPQQSAESHHDGAEPDHLRQHVKFGDYVALVKHEGENAHVLQTVVETMSRSDEAHCELLEAPPPVVWDSFIKAGFDYDPRKDKRRDPA